MRKAAVLPVLMAVYSAGAQQLSRFEEHPAERRQFIEAAHARSVKDRQEAKTWAKVHGKQMRFERNGVLYQLAAIENGKPLYRITHNKNAGISSAANLVWSSPYGLDGAGISVGVWDGGEVLTTHQEFGGRVTYMPNQTEPVHFHATHVGGTIAAAGINSGAKGMAPAATIKSYDWDDDFGEMAAAAATAPGQASGLYLSNHSYGFRVGIDEGNTGRFGKYNYYARQSDVVVAGHAYYLPFFSAGNDRDEDGAYKSGYPNGYDTQADYAIAKNVMTVGAVNDAVSGGVRSVGNATMASFSSWGPADDGRIKPDIVANGVGLTSTWNNYEGHGDYWSISGTSMSSPSACGSAALLVEYYKELFSGGAMRASTLKGLIIHTADDLGRPGPDYAYGWGLMNTKAAADLLKAYADGAGTKLTEATVTTGQPSDTYSFLWNGTDPIRVTLCWTDPAGSEDGDDDDRTPDLVNDLDLKVTGPGGTYYPYKLNYANPTANATANSENNIDNVEQVYIAEPAAGLYTITIDYDGSLSGGSQWYSLLVSGDSADSDADGIPDGWEMQYFGGATNAVATMDADGDGLDNYGEYIAGTVPNDAGSVFKVTSYEGPASGGSPVVINWSTVAGRVYSIGYTPNLKYVGFSNFPDATSLPYTQNSYTDSVVHAENCIFYRVEVGLAE